MDIVTQIVQAVVNGFDFTYCVVVNLLTYLIISALVKLCKGDITRVAKRVVLLLSIVIIGVVYHVIGTDARVLVNSAVLAPISWSWIFKPIMAKLGYDYKQIDKQLN